MENKLTYNDWVEFIHLYIELYHNTGEFASMVAEACGNDCMTTLQIVGLLASRDDAKCSAALGIMLDAFPESFDCNEQAYLNAVGYDRLLAISPRYSNVSSYLKHVYREGVPSHYDDNNVHTASDIIDCMRRPKKL